MAGARGVPVPKRPPRGSALGMHLTTAGSPLGLSASETVGAGFGSDGGGVASAEALRERRSRKRSRRHGKEDTATSRGDPLATDGEADERLEAMEVSGGASETLDMLAIYQVKALILDAVATQDRKHTVFSERCRRIVQNDRFEYCAIVVIILDFIVLALETDHYEEATATYDILSVVFLLLFTLELFMRVAANLSGTYRRVMITDFVVVAFSFVDVVARAVTESISLSVLKILRVFRLIRIMRFVKVVSALRPLYLLSEAVTGAAQPLFFALMVTLLLIVAFAVMIAMLVPDAIKDSDEVEEVVLRYYGTIPKAVLSLLVAMTGSPEWGMEPGFVLLEHGGFSSAVLLGGIVLSAFVLFLALSGLVTGVFLEQLFEASSKADDVRDREDLSLSHEALRNLDAVFTQAGFTSHGEKISWHQVEENFKLPESKRVLETLHLDMKDAENVFMHLDSHSQGGGLVEKDEFVFSLFKLRAVSRSIDMLSVDFQQEKILDQLNELHTKLKKFSGALQHKFFKLHGLLPAIRQDIKEATDGIEEVRRLEEELLGSNCDGSAENEAAVADRLDMEELSANFELSRRLARLEEAAERLGGDSEGGGPPPADDDDAVAQVAAEIVESVKAALARELAALSGTA